MSNELLIKDYSRRDFLKITGASLVTAALGSFMPGCATIDLKKDWSKIPVKDFDMEGFDGWFVRNKLYNGVNPNLIFRHSGGNFPTFKATLFSYNNATPGIDYSVYSGEEMVAAAEGEVLAFVDLDKLDTGRAGGMVVQVAHPNREEIAYVSHYAHLGELFVSLKEKVNRGDPIGSVPGEHTQWAKLLSSKGRNLRDYIDPDNYGQNHSYMDYGNGPLDIDEEIISNPKLMGEKAIRQTEIVGKFNRSRSNWDKHILFNFHSKEIKRPAAWSSVENFRYLEELYKINSNLFPDLSKDQFESLKNEFYANQPIILTLPLVKGGKTG